MQYDTVGYNTLENWQLNLAHKLKKLKMFQMEIKWDKVKWNYCYVKRKKNPVERFKQGARM